MPPAPEEMTRAQLESMVADAAAKAVGPALTAALGPITKASENSSRAIDLLIKRDTPAEPDAMALRKAMGPHPIGRMLKALALATLDGGSPAGNADDVDRSMGAVKKSWPTSVAEPTLKWLGHVKTTLLAGNASAAGAMVMPDYDPEWILLLRNNAVIRGIARTLPMPRGAVTRRRQASAGIAYYQGETDVMTVSNLTIGTVSLSYKKLTAICAVGNDLIRFAGGDAERMVQEDFLQVVALREDRAFINGNPPADGPVPQGIYYQTAAGNRTASAGTSLANFQTDITTAIKLVQASNVMATPENSYILMSVSNFWRIFALATTTGDMLFAAGLSQAVPRIFGFRVLVTTQLEVSNSWIGANLGMIIFVHAPSLEIHDSMARTVETFRGGAYNDTATTVRSGISNDETVITCIAEHDFYQRYDTAAAVITGFAT